MLRVRNGTGGPRSRRKSKKFAINDENDVENIGARRRKSSKMGLGGEGDRHIMKKKGKSARKPLGVRNTNRAFGGDITNRQIKKTSGGAGSMIKKKPRFKIVIDNENEPPPIEYAPVSRVPVNDCIFDDEDCPQKIVQNIFKKKSRKLPDRIEFEECVDIISDDFGLDESVPPLDDLGDDDFSFPWEE